MYTLYISEEKKKVPVVSATKTRLTARPKYIALNARYQLHLPTRITTNLDSGHFSLSLSPLLLVNAIVGRC